MTIRGSKICIRTGEIRHECYTVALRTEDSGAYSVVIAGGDVDWARPGKTHYWAMTDSQNALLSLASYHEAVEHYEHQSIGGTTVTLAPAKATAEQVNLVNEIWEVSCLLIPAFGWGDLKVLVQDGDEILPEHRLRRILLSLKTKHRKGKPLEVNIPS